MRVGLIGCGGIGAIRAQALASAPSWDLVVASDVDGARAEELAQRYGGEPTSDWRALIAREDVDAVLVSTPPHLHAEMCVEALKQDKHVLCEKPLARTPNECRHILDIAEQSGRFLATGFNYRFYPSVQKARKLLDSGIIGELDHIRSYAGYSATDHGQEWIHDIEIMGGGALRDNGIHLIDLTCYFLGEVAETKGFATNFVWQFEGCEDNGFGLLRNTEGRVASLQASWTEWQGYELRLEIYGTRGCIRTWCFPMLTEVVSVQERGGKTTRRKYRFLGTFIGEHLRSYRWVVYRSFIQELEAFAKAIDGRSTQLATGRDGWRAVQIAHEIGNAAKVRES